MTSQLAPQAWLLDDPDGQRLLLPRSLHATARLHDGDPDPWAWLRGQVASPPLWAARLAEAGVAPAELDADALALIPPLSRAELADRWREAVVVDPDDGAHLVAVRSSGSTGQPVRVLRDRYDCLHLWAVLRYVAARLKIALPPSPSVVFLCTLPGGLEWEAPVPVFDEARLRRISTAKPDPWSRVVDADPVVLNTGPAGLHWLMQQRGALRPRLITSSAQHLPDALRDAVEDRFGAPVVDLYALTETGPVAWTCGHRARHVLVPDVHVESVDGELLITRLRPSPLILLRYASGDGGAVSTQRCACGLEGPVITGLRGRAAVDFITPDGGRRDAWRYAAFFKHTSLHRFRLTQTGPAAFRLEVDAPMETTPLAAALERDGFVAPRIEQLVAAVGDGKAIPFVCAWNAGSADRG